MQAVIEIESPAVLDVALRNFGTQKLVLMKDGSWTITSLFNF
jgi:hypothetical protein